jgi:hypothetical protein
MLAMERRTWGWYAVRLELALGIVPGVLAGYLFFTSPAINEPFHDQPEILGLPGNLVVLVIGVLGYAVGLAWMVRMARGPRDEPPAWRYRDR